MQLCHPLPKTIIDEFLQVAARAICDRPADSPAQRESRTRQMVYSTMAFEPRDGLEYMLSVMLVGHFNLLLDSMRDVFQGQMDQIKAKSKTTIVALDRSLLAYAKELRICAGRPLAKGTRVVRADDAIAEREAAGEAAGIVPDRAPERPADVAAVADAVIGDPVVPAAAAPVPAKSVVAKPIVSAPAPVARVQAARNSGGSVDVAANGARTTATNGARAGQQASPGPETPVMELEPLDALGEQHLAAFHDAFRALAETLEEARALDRARPAEREPETLAASGD
jgi:hypothetical protein